MNSVSTSLSTGPRSAEGKDISRFNSLKHGIDARLLVIPGEDPDELAALANDYHDQFHPRGPVEILLLRTLVQSDWYLRRYDRIEAILIKKAVPEGADPLAAIADLFAQPGGKNNPFPHLFRRRSAAQRDWFRAFKELQRLQKARETHEDAGNKIAGATGGFVLSPDKKPAAATGQTASVPEKLAS